MKGAKCTGIKEKLIDAFLNKYSKGKQTIASNAEMEGQYAFDLFRIAQDRYSIVKDVNFLCGPNGDIRFQRANSLIGEDATRGGFSIVVNGSSVDRKRKIRQGKSVGRLAAGAEGVQKILDDFLERTQLHILCAEHAKALLRDGDLFLNVVVDLKSGLVLRVKRVPTLTIKKNVDEYGEFVNPEKAFSQINANEIYKLSQSEPPYSSRLDFSLYQMNHIRWLADETQIYGISQYGVSRKCYHMLNKMEESLAYRRMYRSVSKRSHRIEKGNRADIEQYKRDNAMVDKDGNPTKNAHMLTDYIGNVEVTALHDEANLDEIKDVELMENTLWINLLVPKAIITGGQSINRDVLKVQYPHYLQNLETVTDRLEYGDNSIYSGYRAIIDLQLMLAGINPEAISYDVVWSQKTYDTTLERIESIQKALGKDGGKQLISHEKAIQLIAKDFDIEDPVVMYQRILQENRDGSIGINSKIQIESKKKDVALNDALEESQDKLDREIERFQEEWNAFFNAYYDDVSNSTIQTDVGTFMKGAEELWEKRLQNHFPPFYMDYINKAGLLGIEGARIGIQQFQQKEKLLSDEVELQIRIDSPDIYDDLFNLAGTRISNIKETTLKLIRKELAEDFDNGLGWKECMRRLEPIIKDNARAESIAVSELSWAYNRCGERMYRNAGFDGLEWNASRDLKTCDYCRSMHGQVFPANNHPDNPDHPHCRCTWLPARL